MYLCDSRGLLDHDVNSKYREKEVLMLHLQASRSSICMIMKVIFTPTPKQIVFLPALLVDVERMSEKEKG